VWYSSVLCLLFDAIENKNQASCTLGHDVGSTACSIVHEARNTTGTGIFSCLIISACTTHRLGITLSNTWLLVQHTGLVLLYVTLGDEFDARNCTRFYVALFVVAFCLHSSIITREYRHVFCVCTLYTG